MSSSRFPGKVLAPFRGRPLIAHVLDQIGRALRREDVILATSSEPSDDPLDAYVREQGVRVFRGPLDDVFARFQQCVATYPCARFFRICADSPLLDGRLFTAMLDTAEQQEQVDLVTNVFPRTYPKGQSLELVTAATFLRIDASTLTADEREHVTRVFYNSPSRFRIVNVRSADPALSGTSVAVDTLEDLRALERSPFAGSGAV